MPVKFKAYRLTCIVIALDKRNFLNRSNFNSTGLLSSGHK